jgi:hypothetical protein
MESSCPPYCESQWMRLCLQKWKLGEKPTTCQGMLRRVSIIDDVFTPIYGKPCWQAQQGYGSFLTFEFGEPHLCILEPRQPRKPVSARVEKLLGRRLVTVRGDWHLWIYLCDWRILSRGQVLADNNSKRRVIRRATSELNGQALVRLTVNESLVSIFEFDLGGRLEAVPNTKAYEKTDDLWLLFEPSGHVFTLRADGQCCRMPGDTPPDKGEWRPLSISG